MMTLMIEWQKGHVTHKKPEFPNPQMISSRTGGRETKGNRLTRFTWKNDRYTEVVTKILIFAK